jgi:hypothetical protein
VANFEVLTFPVININISPGASLPWISVKEKSISIALEKEISNNLLK